MKARNGSRLERIARGSPHEGELHMSMGINPARNDVAPGSIENLISPVIQAPTYASDGFAFNQDIGKTFT
jgi:hypothetical protein